MTDQTPEAQAMALVRKMAVAFLWDEDPDAMEGDGISRAWQEAREEEAQDWIIEARAIVHNSED